MIMPLSIFENNYQNFIYQLLNKKFKKDKF
jgi:hypothetical protein